MRLFPKHSTRLHPRSLLLAADVEGAEYEVLKNANPRAFSVVLVETQGGSREKNRAVHQLLTSSGLQVSSEVRVPSSSVYVRPELQLTIAQQVLPPALRMSGARPGHCGATIDRDPGNCNAGDKGSWRISRFRKFNVSSCIHRCKFECPRCRSYQCRFRGMIVLGMRRVILSGWSSARTTSQSRCRRASCERFVS